MQPWQNKAVNKLLQSTGLIAQKSSLVLSYTSGRSESRKDLTEEEANALISYLKTQDNNKVDDGAQKMRRKLISLAHKMLWYKPGTSSIDMARIDGWCKQYGLFKKPLNDHSYAELTHLLTQFKAVHKSYLSSL